MAAVIPRATRFLERLAVRSALASKAVSLYYTGIVSAEAQLARIGAEDNILCIGGGPFPCTAILLHELTGASVTVIDNDNQSVELGRQLTEKLGCGRKIQVLLGDGRSFPLEKYSVVHVAAQVSPLEKVFRHLQDHCRQGTKILVRLPKQGLAAFYEPFDEGVFWGCNAKVQHRGRNTAWTLLFLATGEETP